MKNPSLAYIWILITANDIFDSAWFQIDWSDRWAFAIRYVSDWILDVNAQSTRLCKRRLVWISIISCCFSSTASETIKTIGLEWPKKDERVYFYLTSFAYFFPMVTDAINGNIQIWCVPAAAINKNWLLGSASPMTTSHGELIACSVPSFPPTKSFPWHPVPPMVDTSRLLKST